MLTEHNAIFHKANAYRTITTVESVLWSESVMDLKYKDLLICFHVSYFSKAIRMGIAFTGNLPDVTHSHSETQDCQCQWHINFGAC